MKEALNKIFKIVILSLFFFILTEVENRAEAGDSFGKPIIDISVIGNKLASSKNIILHKIRLTKGSEFSQEVLKSDFKRIYETGLFKDIKIDLQEEKEGIKLIFIVEENTLIKDIKFSGDDNIKSKEIQEALKELPVKQQFKRGKPYNQENLSDNLAKIKSFYNEKGYYFTEVTAKETYSNDSAYVTIKFNIEEGSSTQIRKVKISGNTVIPENEILNKIKTWSRSFIFFHDRVFKKEDFDQDLVKIVEIYDRKGYVKAKVIRHSVDEIKESYKWRRFTINKTWLDISIDIEEGNKYYFNNVSFSGRTKFPENKETEWKNIMIGRVFKREVKNGDIFSNFRVKEIIENIRSSYSELGYIYCQVNPRQVFDEEKKTVTVLFEIEEGIQVFLEKIKISGNKVTKDKVIRREFVINPGDIFNGTKVRRSVQKLYNLGYFEDIQIDTQPTSFRERLNLLAKVKEKSTGRFMAGVGYSSVDKLVGTISLNKTNLFGNGQEIDLSAQVGKISNKYEFSFTDPYFLDTKTLFGFDLFSTDREIFGEEDVNGDGNLEKTAYNYRKKGWAIRLGRPLSEYVKAGLRYNNEKGRYRIIGSYPLPSDVIEENVITRSLGLTLTCDTRDNYFFPTKGSYNTWSVTYAGGPLGGTGNFVKNTLETRWHFRTFSDFVLVLRGRAGYVSPFDGSAEVPRIERFDVGGAYTVRGYDERRIADGKKTMLVTNIEYMYPLSDQLRGLIFYDAGNAWDEVKEVKISKLKRGAGIGLRIETPVFPIMLDYGWGFDEGGEIRGLFHFNLGLLF
ncbi:MAG: outer membrane protein assembly factor BamA [bacterium]|nr:outer membrane protein assembly factor BamA [bacterium]